MRISSSYPEFNVRNNYIRPNFKRSMAEHVSWGARYFQAQHKANFKLFTFPDAQRVFVEIGKKAADTFGKMTDRGVKTILAAGAALSALQILPKDEKTELHEMENKGDGVFETKGIDIEEGAEYRFVIQKADDTVSTVKDPYSKRQDDINGWSKIYNQDTYQWRNTAWIEGFDTRRIVRNPHDKFGGLQNLVIEEINIPTLSDQGTFDGARTHLKEIANRGIATAVEIMPVENSNSLGWSYDGVDKFAVNSKLGGADKLKEFVDYAHSLGLNVIMDIVPNHMGPDGDYLNQTGPYIDYTRHGEFGNKLNYDGKHNRYVRDWIVNEALWYVNEFKVDGLRLDLTHECSDSDWVLKQIVDEVNHHNPKVFLIAEDQRCHDDRITNKDWRASSLHHDTQLSIIDDSVESYEKGYTNRVRAPQIGFDSDWDYEYMHRLDDLIQHPYNHDLWGFDNIIKRSLHRTKYHMSHDEIGNHDGTRLIPKIIAQYKDLDLYHKMDGWNSSEIGQHTAQLSQKLAQLCLSDDIYELSRSGELDRIAIEMGMRKYEHIDPYQLDNAFKTAFAKHKLSLGTVMTTPGPKMYFQGDDALDMAAFKFFRELSSDKYDRQDSEYVRNKIAQKGYDQLESIARPDCVINKTNFKDNKTREQMIRFSKDLSDIIRTYPAMISGNIVATHIDEHNKIHVHHLMKDNSEFLIIKNFGCGFLNDYGYGIHFPDGNWNEILNSDETKYGGSGTYTNNRFMPINRENQHLKIAPNSIIILKRN